MAKRTQPKRPPQKAPAKRSTAKSPVKSSAPAVTAKPTAKNSTPKSQLHANRKASSASAPPLRHSATLPLRHSPSPPPARLTVATAGLPRHRYSVVIGHALISHGCPELTSALSGRRAALLVVDAGLGPSLVEPMIKRLEAARLRWGVCIVRASEDEKSFTTLERILAEAARLRLERRDLIIALGGGITTDIAGFAAATYRRGIDVLQCPTSLLAMVDAAVGGKTAVNLLLPASHAHTGTDADHKPRLIKNAVGSFHQPALVLCDASTLLSLPKRELRAGLAECIKHALIGKALADPKLLDWTEANLDAILALSPRPIAELLRRNIACKARVVQQDERETSTKPHGGRMMLNLGHTFAHAIETLPGLSWRDAADHPHIGPLKHGEAVALGLLCAAVASESLNLLKPAATSRKPAPAVGERLRTLLHRVGLPTRISGLPDDATLLARMADDKKVSAGRLRLILPLTGGLCKVRDDVPASIIARALAAIRA